MRRVQNDKRSKIKTEARENQRGGKINAIYRASIYRTLSNITDRIKVFFEMNYILKED